MSRNVDGEPVADPILATVPLGDLVAIAARLDESTIMFDRIEAKSSELLGPIRRVPVANLQNATVWWEQPTVLYGYNDVSQAQRLRTQSGQVVMLPLRYRVIQGVRNDSPMGNWETAVAGVQRLKLSKRHLSFLTRQCIVFLRATVGSTETAVGTGQSPYLGKRQITSLRDPGPNQGIHQTS